MYPSGIAMKYDDSLSLCKKWFDLTGKEHSMDALAVVMGLVQHMPMQFFNELSYCATEKLDLMRGSFSEEDIKDNKHLDNLKAVSHHLAILIENFPPYAYAHTVTNYKYALMDNALYQDTEKHQFEPGLKREVLDVLADTFTANLNNESLYYEYKKNIIHEHLIENRNADFPEFLDKDLIQFNQRALVTVWLSLEQESPYAITPILLLAGSSSKNISTLLAEQAVTLINEHSDNVDSLNVIKQFAFSCVHYSPDFMTTIRTLKSSLAEKGLENNADLQQKIAQSLIDAYTQAGMNQKYNELWIQNEFPLSQVQFSHNWNWESNSNNNNGIEEKKSFKNK